MNTDDLTLPELGDDRVDEIETALFAEIARERADERRHAERTRVRAVRRGRIWMGGAAAAAVVAVAAVIGPQVLTGTGASSTADSAVLQSGTAELMGGGPGPRRHRRGGGIR
ncbi:hypothetical protein [Microbacterium sp.]|uniref:hypothetical protein n=1 Tax=Microbacterium sp. TaxID=51671 RepID=UPI0039E30B2C